MSIPDDDRLSAYLDDELTELERKRLEVELRANRELQQGLEELTTVRDQLRRQGPLMAPPGFAAGILDALDEEPAPAAASWWRRPLGVPIQGVVAFAMAAAVLMLVLPESPVPSEAPAAREMRFESAPKGQLVPTHMAPDGYRLVLAEGIDRAAVLDAIEAQGAETTAAIGEEGVLTLQLASDGIAALRMTLKEFGTLQPLGEPRVVEGDVSLRLELVSRP